MQETGCPFTMMEHASAKIFVMPGQYHDVLEAIRKCGIPLFTSGVIISESLMHCLEDVVQRIPPKLKVRVKNDGKQHLANVRSCTGMRNVEANEFEESDWHAQVIGATIEAAGGKRLEGRSKSWGEGIEVKEELGHDGEPIDKHGPLWHKERVPADSCI
jgi:hypothetical protein